MGAEIRLNKTTPTRANPQRVSCQCERSDQSGGGAVTCLTVTLSLPPSFQIYPDEGHLLHSEGSRQHLDQSLVSFFEVCFRPPKLTEDELEQEDEEDS